MKVIPFKIPKSTSEAFRVQVDDMPYLYSQLHQHPEIQITLIKRSAGTLIAGDYVGRFNEGDLFVLGSNQSHVFRNDLLPPKQKQRALAISIFFDQTTLGSSFWQLPEVIPVLKFFNNSAGGFRVAGKKKQLLAQLVEKFPESNGIDKLILFLEAMKLLSTKKELVPLSKQTLQVPIRN